MVPTESGCNVNSGVESATQAAVPGAGAKVGMIGADCCHLAAELLDTLQKCIAVRELRNAHKL
jgi:glycosyltransferase A (GT-A) superfamily protein (DUF2064 family)